MPDMPLPAKFFIAFVIVLALIGLVAFLVRRFGAGALGATSARGRQARLGVIESTAVDSRRRLVLVRRDNVEHLIMLGGPSDVVVEANIVRAQAAAMREAPARAEPPGRAADNGAWPGVPEPAMRAPRGPERPGAPPAVADELPLQPHAEPGPRAPSGDRLAGLAAELARAGGGRVEPTAPRLSPEPTRRPPEPRRPPALPRASSEDAQADSDRHLAAMAQQLEAALRRPGQAAPAHGAHGEPASAPARRPAAEPRHAAEPREPRSSLLDRAMQSRSSASLAPARAKPEPPPPPAREEADEPAQFGPAEDLAGTAQEQAAHTPDEAAGEPHGAAAGAPAEASEPAQDRPPPSLEEEMANLLGRSPGRT